MEWHDGSVGWSRGDRAEDAYLHLPLWLQAPCCGHLLWAYNARHLAVLKEYVGASLRQHRRDPETGWSNRGFLGRLPKWLQDAGKRAAVLKAIAKLEKRLEDTGPRDAAAR